MGDVVSEPGSQQIGLAKPESLTAPTVSQIVEKIASLRQLGKKKKPYKKRHTLLSTHGLSINPYDSACYMNIESS